MENILTKSERREKKRKTKENKWIKHKTLGLARDKISKNKLKLFLSKGY